VQQQAEDMWDVPAILSELILVQSITYEAVVMASVGSARVDSDTNQFVLTDVAVALVWQRVIIGCLTIVSWHKQPYTPQHKSLYSD